MSEEILRPVGGNAPALIEQGRKWRVDARKHMSENELRILHHLERYQFAADTINDAALADCRVLDIGAGDGTGLSVIDTYCQPKPHLHAIEIDAVASERMQKLLPEVEIHNLSVDDFEFAIEYDFTLLFETLGHQHILSDLELLKNITTKTLFLSVPYYRHYEKKFYFYRLYDPVNIKELLQQAMPNYKVTSYGQLHPFNREQDSECDIVALDELDRDPDFIICKVVKA